MMNIINGGAHADNDVDVQEFMVMPLGFDQVQRRAALRRRNLPQLEEGAERQEAEHGRRRRRRLRSRPEEQRRGPRSDPRGDPKAGYKPGEQVCIALDVAATEFYDEKAKKVQRSTAAARARRTWSTSWPTGSAKYPICSIEDGCSEDDWEGWKLLTERLGDKVQLVGDDLFVTNTKRLQRGIDEGIANSILIKVNQIGTLTETIEAIQLAHRNGYTSISSHRSGETEDATIADLAVALAPARSKPARASRTDRMAKYNQLLRIEEELGDAAIYGGPLFRKR